MNFVSKSIDFFLYMISWSYQTLLKIKIIDIPLIYYFVALGVFAFLISLMFRTGNTRLR